MTILFRIPRMSNNLNFSARGKTNQTHTVQGMMMCMMGEAMRAALDQHGCSKTSELQAAVTHLEHNLRQELDIQAAIFFIKLEEQDATKISSPRRT